MYKVINPFDNSTIFEYEYTTQNQVDDSTSLLKEGLEQMSEMTTALKAEVLYRLADLLRSNKKELAQLITNEMGKVITESLVEIDRSITTVICAADTIKTMTEEVLDSDAYGSKRDKMGIVKRFPMGIILAVTPFNFPINLSVHKIAPAFAAGNTVLFKPGPQNYLSAKRLVELCYEAGMAKSYLQLICPDIPVLSKLISSKNIQCISFTGGTQTAKKIAENCGIKKLIFELGGNDPLIIMPDADLDKASDTAINNRFGSSGQRCTASKRVFVHKDVYTKFKTLLVAKAEKLNIGNPQDSNTFVGPLVNSTAADIVEGRINDSISKGAKLLLGNKRVGNIIYPTILENVSDDHELVSDETFGPVIPLMSFEVLSELIERVNSTEFGLQSGVFTNDLKTIKHLYAKLDVGALIVNDGPGFRAEHFPFGGVKNSGLGREGIKYAIDQMSVLKTLVL